MNIPMYVYKCTALSNSSIGPVIAKNICSLFLTMSLACVLNRKHLIISMDRKNNSSL